MQLNGELLPIGMQTWKNAKYSNPIQIGDLFFFSLFVACDCSLTHNKRAGSEKKQKNAQSALLSRLLQNCRFEKNTILFN
jgi:hypothetical protein